jgi:hypothetical protein
MNKFFCTRGIRVFVLLQGLLIAAPVLSAGLVEILDPWARATVPGQKVGGVYMQIIARESMRLTGVKSAAAETAGVHDMKMENGMMRMRAVPFLQLPAGQPVKLQPGGYHIMLMDLRRSLVPGQKVKLELTFEDTSKRRHRIVVQALVRDREAGTNSHDHQ